ncbi:hypothetical protein SCHPADRAFT_947768 [Schizopora paradoxa]|uniref:Uncharacterized protein n=1 Tax=Schizopora paradoxa TaxID=27342 RepID=A0A0H2QXK2_9AGAM|nr:hypothetical protein SCHPADRAFT_947768 [Schizopora paradoxa]
MVYICLIQVAAIAIKAYMVVEALKSVTFTPSPRPSIAACVPALGTNINIFTYCIDVALEFQLLCLSLYKGFFQWKCNSTPLIRTLHRDGFIYFAVLLCISLTNTIVSARMFNAPYSAIVIVHQRVFHSILASRVIINLRKAALEERFSTISTAIFRDREVQDRDDDSNNIP